LLEAAALDPVARQEDEPAPVLAGLRQNDARLLADVLQELVGHLHQHARPVAGVRLGARGPAVVEVLQYLYRLLQDLVRLAPLHVHDEADSAPVVLEPRIGEALLGRRDGRPAPGARRVFRSAGHWVEAGFSVSKHSLSQTGIRWGRGPISWVQKKAGPS